MRERLCKGMWKQNGTKMLDLDFNIKYKTSEKRINNNCNLHVPFEAIKNTSFQKYFWPNNY